MKMQFVLHRGAAATVPGEDCLRVNLWTPEINASHKRPVMVYMHGGGFSGGSGHDLLSYDGESLARNHDAVVVTHNHRLNVYGYLNLGHLGGEEYASSANVGMLDLVAVLEWVRDNITTFGGDPGSVTIFGQSGGGGKVLALMAMPAAKGLFHRAIVQSGPFLKSLSPDYSGRLAELVIAELGLSKSQVSELQVIPVDRLSGAAAEAMKKMPRPKSSLRESVRRIRLGADSRRPHTSSSSIRSGSSRNICGRSIANRHKSSRGCKWARPSRCQCDGSGRT